MPLAAQGIEVHGLDASPAMVAKLRAKPGGERIPVTIGDFAAVNVSGEFALVYVVFNTFFALLTQEDQLRCFEQVAAHLAPGGCFLLEVFVPNTARYSNGNTVSNVTRVTNDHVEYDVAQHDPVTQLVVAQKVIMTDGQVRLYPIQVRYAWPPSLI